MLLNRILAWRGLAVAGFVFAYFVFYPDDIETIAAPLEAVTRPIAKILQLSFAVSPWLYATVAVAIIASAIVRVWGVPRTRPN